MKQLTHDFGTRYKRGDINGVDQYFTLLEEKGAERLFFEALMKRDEFEKLAEALDDHLQNQQELPDIRADIDAYCDKI